MNCAQFLLSGILLVPSRSRIDAAWREVSTPGGVLIFRSRLSCPDLRGPALSVRRGGPRKAHVSLACYTCPCFGVGLRRRCFLPQAHLRPPRSPGAGFLCWLP